MTQPKSDFHRFTRIYLIGMMGAGKTTIARLLARRIGWIWVDTDTCVERNSLMPVEEIFAQYGEEEFRKKEWYCTRQTVKFEQIVVACGGGAPCHHQAIDLMLASGSVVYLNARVDTLISRLAANAQTRPLLRHPEMTIEEKLRALLSERESIYNKATLTIQTDDLSETEVVEKVLEELNMKDELSNMKF